MNSEIMKALTGSTNCKLKNEEDLKKTNPKSFTATISGAKKVYNLFPGTVLFLGFYKGMGTITIAVSNHEVVRYLNMRNIKGWNYTSLPKGEYLGDAYSPSGLQFEYCTQWKGESKYPVRVNSNMYFKQNPLDILNGIYVPSKELNVEYGIIRPNKKSTFTEEQLLEWGPVNIDNSDVYVPGAQIVGE